MVITFGHQKRKKPDADHYFDVRGLSHDLRRPEANAVVDEAVKAYQKGQTICIGCEQGSHRSVELGERIGKKLGVKVKHLDRPKQKQKVHNYSY